MPLLGVAALLFRTATLAAPVTLDTGLVSAEAAVAKLSAASGVPLRVSPVLARYPLLLKLKGRSLDDVTARIARVLGGEWRKDGDGYLLGADNAAFRQTDLRWASALETEIGRLNERMASATFDEKFAANAQKESKKMEEKAMAAFSGDSEQIPDFTAMFTAGPMANSPASKAIGALLKAIGPATIAGIAPGERVVLAMRPTQMQGPMPPGSDRILLTYLADQRRFRAATKAARPPAPGDAAENADFASSFLFEMMTGVAGNDPAGTPTDALLIINSTDSALSVELNVYDDKGRAMEKGGQIIAIPVPPPPTPLVAPAETAPVAVLPLVQEWAEKFGASLVLSSSDPIGASKAIFGGGADRQAAAKPLSPELRARLLDPVMYEPGGPAVEALASSLPDDVIASIPDDGLRPLAMALAVPDRTNAKVLAALATSRAYAVSRAEGVTEIAAATPARMRRTFVERAALRDLLRSAVANGVASRDDLAAFAAQSTKEGASNLAEPLLQILERRAVDLMSLGNSFSSQFEGYRVWGLLPPEARAALAAGKKLPFSTLPPLAAEAIARDLFAADEYLSSFDASEMDDAAQKDAPEATAPPSGADAGNAAPDEPETEPVTAQEEPRSGDDPAAAVTSAMNSLLAGVYGDERTVRFASGLPNGGFLSATVRTADVYRMRSSATGRTTFGEAMSLGMARGMQSLPFARRLGIAADYDRFTPAKSETTTLMFNYAPKAIASHGMIGYSVVGDSEITYDQMPAEFRKQVDEMSKMGDMMRDQSKGKAAPP